MFTHDLRLAARQLLRAPGFSLAVILTLTLGIGVNTAVFTLVDGFLLRGLPYPEPERLAMLNLHRESPQTAAHAATSYEQEDFTSADWGMLTDAGAPVELAARGGTGGVNLKASAAAGGAVRYAQDSRVSADYFKVLGIPMELGRGFTAEEDMPHGPAVAVVSYSLWQSAFHGDPSIVGKTIDLKGEAHTVVGVLPAAARLAGDPDLFTPLHPSDASGECGGTNCEILARLKPGATWAQADAQLGRLHLQRMAELESRYHAHAWVYTVPLSRALAGDMSGEVRTLMLAVSFILLIACGNLAGLTLVRVSRRTQEIATRLALGAVLGDILRQLWTETIVLALTGAATGLALAFGIVSGLNTFLPPEMLPLGGLHLDLRVLGFALGAAVISSLLFGALPALLARRVDLRTSLSSGSRSVSAGSGRLRQWLIGAEVALTVVLLAAAGLLVRTLIHLETLPPGFDAHNVTTATVSLDDARYHDSMAFQALLTRSLDAMRKIPGVEGAAVGLSVPYQPFVNDDVKFLEGTQAGTDQAVSLSYVTPGYFQTLRIPLLAGRDIQDSDTSTSMRVAVVNASFGEMYFHTPNVVGRHFETGHSTITIVGVVGDVQNQSHAVAQSEPLGTEPIWYLPATQVGPEFLSLIHAWFQPSWIVRTGRADAGLPQAMQAALTSADPTLPFSSFSSMDDILATQLAMQRIQVLLLTTLGALALVLSTIGIGSLVSSLVVQRRREIGIRMALGSTLGQAMVQVSSAGMLAAGAGMAVGILASFGALRVLASYLYGVKPWDPVTMAAVIALLALAAAAASLTPALRIGQIDPAETLRAE
ncbi:ABC transporter permease [Silvibacterium sp.]|uniref:ABC transporter permease n=1 Tax=Silvibacterium sp. TaxID=1964179 RepID=UPI0039E44983